MSNATSALSIGGREVGPDRPVLVIGEIGVNHDGSVERAVSLVRQAREAGADAIKIQVFSARRLMNASGEFAAYQRERCAEGSPVEMLERYELPAEGVVRVCEEARAIGLIAIATPFSIEDVDVLERAGVAAVKIASPDIVNRPLLLRAVELGLPMLLSTGAATMDEIERTCGWMREWGASFGLLHCVSAYPTADGQAHVSWVGELSRFGVVVGYSDHAEDELAGALAVAAGACVVEKHLTYDRGAAGPDHAASCDPEGLRRYVGLIRRAERLRGQGPKRVLEVEQDVRRVSRQSLVARRDLSAGHVVEAGDLMVQRPGTGIPAADVELVVGRRLTHAVGAGHLLEWGMFR